MDRRRRPVWQMPPGLPQAPDRTWTYLVDDVGIIYGPGWWPFYRDPRKQFAATDHTPQPGGIRLAPDIEFWAWRTEYVALWPTNRTGTARGTCLVVPATAGRPDSHATFDIHLLDDRWIAHNIRLAGPGRPILNNKITRVIAFLSAATAERDHGTTRPTTAHERHERRRRAADPD